MAKWTQTQKLNFINGGTQERKIGFIKIFFHLCINGGTQERKKKQKKVFNISVFLHHIIVRSRVSIIPRLRKRRVVKQW